MEDNNERFDRACCCLQMASALYNISCLPFSNPPSRLNAELQISLAHMCQYLMLAMAGFLSNGFYRHPLGICTEADACKPWIIQMAAFYAVLHSSPHVPHPMQP